MRSSVFVAVSDLVAVVLHVNCCFGSCCCSCFCFVVAVIIIVVALICCSVVVVVVAIVAVALILYREMMGLLVLLVPQDHRGCQEREGKPEPVESEDLQGTVEFQGPLERRAPQVCRACQEVQESLAEMALMVPRGGRGMWEWMEQQVALGTRETLVSQVLRASMAPLAVLGQTGSLGHLEDRDAEAPG